MKKEELIDFCEMKSQLEPENEDIFNYIIEALEQRACDDCISRQVVLDYLDKMPSELTSDGRRMVRRRTLEEYISDTLPPVTPQPKTGHWIEYECDEDKYDRIECSECGQSFIVDSYHWCDIGFTKDDLMYCPNCGAKMKEVNDNADSN